jgi:aminoglycoside phosphotransferase (APT) family kinase protein
MPSPGRVVGFGRTAVVYEWGPDAVLKLFRPEMPAVVAESEAVIAAAVTDAGADAPRFLGKVEVEGRTGILYERLRGVVMPDRFVRRPWTLDSLVRTLAELHVRMHERKVTGLPGVRDRLAAAIDRAADVLGRRASGAARTRLSQLPDGGSLCHGDLHPYNVMLTDHGPIAIDWNNAAVGAAAADVTRTAFLLVEGADGNTRPLLRPAISFVRRRLLAVYLREYMRLKPIPAAELRVWRLPVLAARLADGIEEERSMLLEKVKIELDGSNAI